MKRNFWFTAAFFALVVPLGWRAVRLSAQPPFEPGLPSTLRPQIEVSGVEFRHPLPDGAIHIWSGKLSEGREKVGAFRLGISTFIQLEQVSAVRFKDGVKAWRVTAPAARLDQRSLTFQGRAIVRRGGNPPVLVRFAEADLASGKLSGR